MKEGGVAVAAPPSFILYTCSQFVFSSNELLRFYFALIVGLDRTMKSTEPLKRLAQLMLVVLGSTFLVSLLIRLLPVGLEDIYVVNPDPAGRAQEIRNLGLDLNPFAFYLRWLNGFIRGDFGSYVYPGPTFVPVSEYIARTLPAYCLRTKLERALTDLSAMACSFSHQFQVLFWPCYSHFTLE